MEVSRKADLLSCVHYLPRIRLDEGGVVRSVIDLINGLVGKGVSVTLLTHDAEDCPSHWIRDSLGNPRVQEVEFSGARVPSLAKSQLGRALREADVLHLHSPWYPTNIPLAAMAREAGVPYAVTLHGMLDDWPMQQKRWKKRLYLAWRGRRFLENASCVHCTAELEKEQAARRAPRARWQVLPLVVDLSPYKELPGEDVALVEIPWLQGDVPTILFLSRIHPKKGLECLLKAFVLLRERGIFCKLAIAGTGSQSYVEKVNELIGKLALEDRVRLVGMVGGPLKASLFQWADVFVLPTSQENYGLVFLEAMACATQVVTTSGVDIWPQLEEAGAIIVDQDPEEIARVLEEQTCDLKALQERGIRSRAYVFEKLEMGVLASRYVQLYRDLAEDSRR